MKLKRLLAAVLSSCIVFSGSEMTMFESNAAGSEIVTENETETERKENSWRYQDGELIQGENNSKTRAAAYPYAWEYVDGNYMNNIGEVIEGAKLKGIDVSKHQGVIDWEKVKEDGIDFAIIRCGYGDDEVAQDDPKWEYNVSECERLGIPYGVYLYSYATDETMALSEANHVLRLLEGHDPDYPVYLDMEDNSTLGIGNDMYASIAYIFCETVSEEGYDVGIYANKYWWTALLTDEVFETPDWSKWVAQYASACTYEGTYDIWQCTDKGSVDGISSNVDVNFWFGEVDTSSGEGGSGEDNSGEGGSGEDNSGEGGSGEDNSGEGGSGEDNSGEGGSGEDNSGEEPVEYPYAWEYVDGNYMNDRGEIIEGAKAKGIDVSKFQGKIDWEKVKEDGIDYAILRCGYGDDEVEQDDSMWEYNVSECERLGIPYGVYIYSYATNKKMALSEANHALRLLEGHNPEYPVYLALEHSSIAGNGETMFATIAQTFCDTVAEEGYDVGIYAHKEWWNTNLTDSAFDNPDWSKWVVQYESECTYEDTFDMWRCSYNGSVDGISGDVHINFWFSDSKEEEMEIPVEDIFTDVSTEDWFYDGVQYVYGKKLMVGTSETTFGPKVEVSRAQFATIVHRMAGSPEVEYKELFSDVEDGQWYTDGIIWGNENKIIMGYLNGTFGVEDNINREQMALMLYRYAKVKGCDMNVYSSLDSFQDASDVSTYAKTALEWAVGNGIINGKNGNRMDPQGEATRAECAAIVQRFVEKYGE